MSLRPLLLALGLCGLFCPQLLARVVDAASTDDGCPDEMTLMADDDGDDVGVVEAVEVIVPCAVVESGALGAACHDAAFYVVNQTGTLLCRVDVAVLASSARSTSIETAAPAAPSSSSAALALALPTTSIRFQLPRQAITELAPARGPKRLGPGLDLTSFAPRPS